MAEPTGLQKLLIERFPDGATKEEIAAFLKQMSRRNTYVDSIRLVRGLVEEGIAEDTTKPARRMSVLEFFEPAEGDQNGAASTQPVAAARQRRSTASPMRVARRYSSVQRVESTAPDPRMAAELSALPDSNEEEMGGLQELLLQRFPDGATKAEVVAFLQDLLHEDMFTESVKVMAALMQSEELDGDENEDGSKSNDGGALQPISPSPLVAAPRGRRATCRRISVHLLFEHQDSISQPIGSSFSLMPTEFQSARPMGPRGSWNEDVQSNMHADARIAELCADLSSLKQRNAVLEAQLQDMSSELRGALDDKNRLSVRIQQLEHRVEDKDTSLADMAEGLAEQANTMSKAKAELAYFHDHVSQLKEQIRDLQASAGNEAQIEELTTQNAMLRSIQRSQAAEIEQLKEQNAALESEARLQALEQTELRHRVDGIGEVEAQAMVKGKFKASESALERISELEKALALAEAAKSRSWEDELALEKREPEPELPKAEPMALIAESGSAEQQSVMERIKASTALRDGLLSVLGAFQQLQLMGMDHLSDEERIALLTEMSQVCCKEVAEVALSDDALWTNQETEQGIEMSLRPMYGSEYMCFRGETTIQHDPQEIFLLVTGQYSNAWDRQLIASTVVEYINDDVQVTLDQFNNTIPFVNKRDFCLLRGRATLQISDDDVDADSFVSSFVSIVHKGAPEDSDGNFIRAHMMIGGFVITPELVDGEPGSRVVYVGQIDFRGNVPKMINENLAKKRVACLRFIKHALNRRLFEVGS
jgi:uncharacterized coiled-coil protein SlyX